MADEDILTFEQLKDLQNTEQDEDTLGDLDEQFFERVRDYLDRKQRIGGHLNNKEYRNAKHIVKDILDSRQKKIIRLAFLSTKSEIAVDNLLPEEEVLFDKVRESITEHREDIEEQLFGDEDDEEPDESGDETTETTGDEADTDTEDQEPEDDESEPDAVPDDDTTEDDEEQETEDDELLETGDTDEDASEDTDSPDTDEKEPTESDQDEDDGELLFGGGGDSDDDAEDDADEEDTPDDRTAGDLEEESDDDEDDGAADPDSDDTEDDGEEMIEVRMTTDVSEFMGVDLQSYGPFEEGETATIPDENAEVLQDQDKAEPLE